MQKNKAKKSKNYFRMKENNIKSQLKWIGKNEEHQNEYTCANKNYYVFFSFHFPKAKENNNNMLMS